jgi:hypothetical protein
MDANNGCNMELHAADNNFDNLTILFDLLLRMLLLLFTKK